MKRPEEQLHRAVAQFLDNALTPDSWWCHIPNGGGRSKAEAGIFKAMGVKAGVPDILIIHHGRAYWIELKAPPKLLKSGKVSNAYIPLSESQKKTFQALYDVGCHYIRVCRSLEAVQALLNEWRIPTRATVV